MIYGHVPGFEPDHHAAVMTAILNLVPGAAFSLVGDDLADIDWQDDRDMPSEADILAEVERCWQDWHNTEYQRLRKPEYPPIEDYLDGVVKNDQAQIDAYVAACQAVKDQYPKPV
jgi:hypothetical protein